MTSNILIEINHFFSQNDKKGAKKRKLYRFFLVNYNLLNILHNIMKNACNEPCQTKKHALLDNKKL